MSNTQLVEIDEDPDQRRAVDLICSAHRAVIITGGPGTGKTTTLRAALSDPRIAGKNIVLVAPTGKAAKRISEVVGGFPASTIHRLIGYNGEGSFGEERLKEDLIVVDESSMVDVQLLYHLMKIMRPDARLVLMGDADQLPSVGAGCVLRDLIDDGEVPTVRLKTLHRSAKDSWICANAPLILTGERFSTKSADDFQAFEYTNLNEVVDVCAQLVAHNYNAFYLGDFQLLTPMNIGEIGTEVLNHMIAEEVNAARMDGPCIELAIPNATMQQYAGIRDRVIHVKNNYRLEVFNGEIGTIESIDDRVVVVQFGGGKRVEYTIPVAMYQLRLAYALTVHKAQGSEWKHIALVCHGKHAHMWSRQLLYTAVTRAKVAVTLIGNEDGIAAALAQNKPRERFTTLYPRLKELRNAVENDPELLGGIGDQ